MYQVERHFIKNNPEIVRLCSFSKILYNQCNFYMRQAWFSQKRLPDISLLTSMVHDQECFKQFDNTKTAKQTIRQCLTDWVNYRRALVAYKKTPHKFVRCPKPPHYKSKLAQIIFYEETIRRKPRKHNIICPTNDIFSISSQHIDSFKQVIVSPKTFGFIVEVQYEVTAETAKVKLSKDHVCAIDIGVNNLCAISSDQHQPLLVNGRIVKSINQWYNKSPCKSRLRKRYWRLENYFHHVSKLIVQNCVKHGIGTIIIGKNDGWKQECNMGKKSNQTFNHIPHFLLLQKIKYKAEARGIDVVFTEEAYTSKASFFDRDPLPEYSKGMDTPVFSGSRLKRGLYRAKDGRLLNADVNGSANICRKVIHDSEILGRVDRSLAARPVRTNPLRKSDGEGLMVDPSNVQIG